MTWDWYRTALAVLEGGSLSAAARELGLTQPTVGRHIEALEAELGTALFTRSQTGLTPTEAALGIRPYIDQLRATTAALRRVATGSTREVSGTVRITASEMIGGEVLPAFLVRLRRAYPTLEFEVVLSDFSQNLLRREADVAVRMTPPDQDALVAQKVGRVEVGLYARRDYLEVHGEPKTIGQLKNHSLIGYDRDLPFVRAVRDRTGALRRSLFSLRTDSSLAQLSAVRAGFGIGMCHHRLAPRYPELQPVLNHAVRFGFDTWVVMHEDLRRMRRYAVAFEALVEGLKAYTSGKG